MENWSRMLERTITATRNGILITDPNQLDNPKLPVLAGHRKGSTSPRGGAEGGREERGRRVLVRNYRKDATLFWQELSISPVRDERGNLTYFVGVQDDVTGRKFAEARLATKLSTTP